MTEAGALLDRFRAQLKPEVLPPGTRVLVAVSGGADSTALLLLLHGVRATLDLHLTIAHVDHGIRPDSAAVADRVRDLARDLDMPCLIESIALGAGASETLAREHRNAALERMRERAGAEVIATGHHADDQAETILFRVLRGTGPIGLQGMRSRSPQAVIRPLLPFRRQELRDWLETQAPTPVLDQDPTNTDPRHERAWIRSELLPLLETRFPAIVDNLLRTGRQAVDDYLAWQEVAGLLPGLDLAIEDTIVSLNHSALAEHHNALSVMLLRHLCHRLGVKLGADHAHRLAEFVRDGKSGRRFEIGEGWEARIEFERLTLGQSLAGEPMQPAVWGTGDTGSLDWGTWSMAWRREPAGQLERRGLVTWITPGEGEIRAVQPGDRVKPLGGVGHRKVARMLMEGDVPLTERDRFPVCVRGGEVLWLPGICRSELACPKTGEAAIRVEMSEHGR